MLKKCLTLLLFFLFFTAACFDLTSFKTVTKPRITQAATKTNADSAKVSATMPDVQSPAAPILISPSHNSWLKTTQVEFTWQAAVDNMAVAYYQLYLDGQLLLDQIQPTTFSPDYQLKHNPTTGYFSLKYLKDLTQGSHTWKIRAVDTSDNSQDSATWTFTIDSLAPNLLITQVGRLAVSISSQDKQSIPSQPLKLTKNKPWLKGSGEPNSQLTITVSYQDDSGLTQTKKLQTSINAQGQWQQQLGLLPRGKPVDLEIVVTDQAGNQTKLKISIIISQEAIVPPEEIIQEVVTATTPPTIKRLFSISWIKDLLAQLGPRLVAILILLPGLIATWLLARPFGKELNLKILKNIFKVLGLKLWPLPFPWLKTTKGLVYDSNSLPEGCDSGQSFKKNNLLGVPFAHVTVYQQPTNENLPPSLSQLITNSQGRYPAPELKPGNYRFSTWHPDYRFPTNKKRPEQLTLEQFYQGQLFEIKEPQVLALLIPVDQTQTDRSFSFQIKLTAWLDKFYLGGKLEPVGLILISLLILAFYSSLINWLVFGWYVVLVIGNRVGGEK